MRSYTVGRIWDIPIRIHVSLLVVLPVLAWLIASGQQIAAYVGIIEGISGVVIETAPLLAGSTPWAIGFAAAIGLFVSVALHELGHSWVAMRYGLEVESITLWILGGLANLGEIPREWHKEFWIAIAGPIVSVLTGLVCYVALLALPASTPVVAFVLGWLAVTNLVLAVFNMLPAFPMDGGRILRALLARNQPYATATRRAARIGSLFAVVFAVVGILGVSPMLILLALFVYGAATSESRMVVLAELLEGTTVGDLATDAEPVDADDSVDDLVTRMFADRRTEYAVTDAGEVVGVVSAADFTALSPAERDGTRIRSLMQTDLPRLAADLGAFDALVELDRAGATEAFVEDGTDVRVVTREDFSRAMEMRRLVGTGDPF